MITDNTFFTRDELTDKIEVGKSALLKMVKRGKIDEKYYRYVPGKGRGGKILEINPLGLPEPYRRQYLRQAEQQVVELHQQQSDLPDWAVAYATARLDVVRLMEDELYRARKEGRKITPLYDETADMYNSGHILEEAYEVLGEVSGITIRRWLNTYKEARKKGEDVIAALAPNYKTNKGDRSLPDWYQKKLLSVLLHPNEISVRRAIKIVNTNLRRDDKQPPCSMRTAQRWVKEYKDNHFDRWVMIREGRKSLNDKVLPYMDRDWNLLEVGEVLIADGHVLNFDVKHPKTGKAHRPTLVCFYDGRSRYPVGISIMPTENIDNINEALLDGILELGKFPDAVILDNGKAFKANHFTESPRFDDAGIQGIYERYGIMTHFTLPYHGQSKPIEPFFRQLNERFSKMLPTYRGSSIDKKVPRLKRNEKAHKKAYDETVGDWLPTIPQVVAAIKHWARESYGAEEHKGLKKGETPWSVFEAGKGPGVAPAKLIDLMFRAKQVRARRARFRLEGIVYQNWDSLTGYNRPVLVRYTRNIPDRVWVFDISGPNPEFMCIAQAVKAVHPLEKLTNEDGEFDPDYRYRLKQRKKLEKRARQVRKDLDAMNRDMAAPVGNLLPPADPEIETGPPDATPNLRDKGFEINDLDYNIGVDDEEEGETYFQYDYERFEHIAGKQPEDIDEKDIEFLQYFTGTELYSDLYEAENKEWVEPLVSNEQ